MKSAVKIFAIAIATVILATACTKKDITPEAVVNNVTLETSLQPGETYNLDLSAYSAQNTRYAVITQPTNADESVLTSGTCHTSGSYRYKAGATTVTDKVVLQLTKGGKCNKAEEKTNITINVKVEPTRETVN